MYIDLVHTQPLFRDAPDTLMVKYTHPETGVHLEIAYDDLVNTVIAVDALISAPEDAVEEQAEVEPEEPEPALVMNAIEDQVLAGAPSGLRVMRSRIPEDSV